MPPEHVRFDDVTQVKRSPRKMHLTHGISPSQFYFPLGDLLESSVTYSAIRRIRFSQ